MSELIGSLWMGYKSMLQDMGLSNSQAVYDIMAEHYFDEMVNSRDMEGITIKDMELFRSRSIDRTDSKYRFESFLRAFDKRVSYAESKAEPEGMPEEGPSGGILADRYMRFKSEVERKAANLKGFEDAKRIAERYASKNTYGEAEIKALIESELNNPEEPLLPMFIEAHDKSLKHRNWKSKFVL